ncbi:tRNA (adenosine(37)-N6)-threonylcarbamoyltransferase complex transferase subunit TsaD [Mesomycoplasma neurolyticum]|uniref:tRNA N6-adenosine threonylcarbamoyltransferase n=1 Tax=Mesomycoplasma neurolyticum TaxID=2120 RepID=A0A449A485_9BACT|nr:tRNA (adenosine(37)-N6)-threonylcarbamoyltransferase complex transferase subunit TsaD [Mesomycoplasma neurolyticum]VEU59057.1 O-sialoglycoprotein endopeptidase [Mesomycoplasma neurolyticum]
MIILGIESTHDDTSLAILEDKKIIANIIFSQIDLHKNFGGTVPELASREHASNIAIILEEIKKIISLEKIDYIAYANKPGLIGALQIGYLFAKALSLALNKPLKPINHLKGHFFSAAINNDIIYPALGLLTSGGHSQILLANNENDITIIGETQDDAIGEVYDKVARKLNLGFPGGPLIDKIFYEFKTDYESKIKLTTPKILNEFDFSFSGIKTQVINIINNFQNKNIEIPVNEIAFSFQKTAINYLLDVFKKALNIYKVNSIVLSGGVSANKYLRQEFLKLHKNALIPDLKYCTDNGAMIAKAAEIIYKLK